MNNHIYISNVIFSVEENFAVCKLKNVLKKTMEPTSTVINECISELSQTYKVFIRNCPIFFLVLISECSFL